MKEITDSAFVVGVHYDSRESAARDHSKMERTS